MAFWSFQPAVLPALPPPDQTGWARNELDLFILARLEKENLKPSPEADRRTLIRRVSFDLTGLPPAPQEVEAFVTDDSSTAYADLVDRLLSSPRYGERWARHWLDTVHFGETHGYDKDKTRPNAWPYRDYVIRSLNDDKPYSRFVQEQLAGDVLYPEDPDGVVALGFFAAGPWDFVGHVELPESKTDGLIARYNDRDDMVMTAMSTFQSLTVHCARCHDHKFDPITQEDYYGLQAVFAGVDRADRWIDSDPAVFKKRKRLLAEKKPIEQQQHSSIVVSNTPAQPSSSWWKPRRAELESNWRLCPQWAPTRAQATAFTARSLPNRTPPSGFRSISANPFPGGNPAYSSTADRLCRYSRIWFPPALPRGVSARALSLKPPLPSWIRPRRTSANPGDKPVTISAAGSAARFIRVTATRLWQRTGDYVFALGELQAISEGQNVAVSATVTALDTIEAGRWARLSGRRVQQPQTARAGVGVNRVSTATPR